MGGYHSTALQQLPVIGYAQTHSRSQMHEVAVLPLTVANFPDPRCAAFQRLHEIYCTCPRVRQHFAHNSDVPLDRDQFYKQVVVDSSHPLLPRGTAIPAAVATRWRGDEQWDIAGFIGCRGYSSHGDVTDVNLLQMFFRDGHKVPLTMPAVQLAARLFAEMHVAACAQDELSGVACRSSAIPWPKNLEWTIRRQNMEVRRVLEAVLVFWGLRPARASVAEPAYEFFRRFPPHLITMLSNDPTCESPPFATFPLELRSSDDERITIGTNDKAAVASLCQDLAGWATGPSRWVEGVVPSPGLDSLLPADFASRGGRVLVTGLSMNFRGTQQKTSIERRDILGEHVASLLELIQPATKEGDNDAAEHQSHGKSSKLPNTGMPDDYGIDHHHHAAAGAHGQHSKRKQGLAPPPPYHQAQPMQAVPYPQFFAMPQMAQPVMMMAAPAAAHQMLVPVQAAPGGGMMFMMQPGSDPTGASPSGWPTATPMMFAPAPQYMAVPMQLR